MATREEKIRELRQRISDLKVTIQALDDANETVEQIKRNVNERMKEIERKNVKS